jgi:hypothetical protein
MLLCNFWRKGEAKSILLLTCACSDLSKNIYQKYPSPLPFLLSSRGRSKWMRQGLGKGGHLKYALLYQG